MSKESFDRKLEEVAALRSASEDAAIPQLRKALKDRSNLVASKAAAIAGERHFDALTPDLLAAFDRFLRDPTKSDPQCWAKNAIVKALKELEYGDADVFFRGTLHVQLEPVWGGVADTAATLRGTSALALVAASAPAFDVLTRLTEMLNDAETPVRIDAARAIAQLSAREGLLPLRLKALIGDREPEVVGHCFAALLSLAPHDSLSFVARFLESPDHDLRLEAAGALAESHESEAIDLLKAFWEKQSDPAVKRTLLTFLAASPLPAAAGFLLSIIEDASGQTAAHALAALANSRYRTQLQERVAAIVKQKRDPALAKILEANYS